MLEDLLHQIDHETVTAPLRLAPQVINLSALHRDPNRSSKQRKKDRRRAKAAKQARRANRQ